MGGFMGAGALAALRAGKKKDEPKKPKTAADHAAIAGRIADANMEQRAREVKRTLGRSETLEEQQQREISEFGYSMIVTPRHWENRHFNTNTKKWEKCTAKIRRCKYGRHEETLVSDW